MTNPRWTLTTITTSDADLVKLAESVRDYGYKHEEIYRAGLEYLKKEIDKGK